MLATTKRKFCELVDQTLIKHYHLIKTLVEREAPTSLTTETPFMRAVFDAWEQRYRQERGGYQRGGIRVPVPMWRISLGPELFDYGYGPFRWCCLSGKPRI